MKVFVAMLVLGLSLSAAAERSSDSPEEIRRQAELAKSYKWTTKTETICNQVNDSSDNVVCYKRTSRVNYRAMTPAEMSAYIKRCGLNPRSGCM